MDAEKKAFLAEIGPLAAQDCKESGVLASLTLAQAILESGWGLSGLAVKANALFGIKAGKSWPGRVYSAETKECYDGTNLTTITAPFRAYDSWAESIRDHSALLTGKERYAAVVGERDYKAACKAIQAAGYATDPAYTEKLIEIIEKYGLTAYDDGEADKPEGELTMREQERRFRDIVVSTARGYLGTKEGGEKHGEIVKAYNAEKPLPRGYTLTKKDAWCAAFVSVIANKCGVRSIIPKECSCNRMIALFAGMDRWREDENYTPNPGDVMFYDWQDDGKGDNRGQADHVGIVEKVEGGQITVIEGNFDDCVKRRTLPVNGRYIRGFGLPDYASLCVGEDAPTAAAPSAVMRPGATVTYTGPIYATSAGTGRGRQVSGTFTVKYYSPDNRCGVHLDDLGWVSEYACVVTA